MSAVCLTPLPALPEIREGDDIAALIARAADQAGWVFQEGDVLVIAQKIVSKAEGRVTRLRDVSPSKQSNELAQKLNVDPRKIEVVLKDSARVIRIRSVNDPHTTGVIIT